MDVGWANQEQCLCIPHVYCLMQVVLLENTRFHAEDLRNDSVFASQLAENADVFVNDAFGVMHRNQASVTVAIPLLPFCLVHSDSSAMGLFFIGYQIVTFFFYGT